MPAAIQYTFDTKSDEYKQVEDDFAREITERGKTFKRNWDYYDGIMPEPLKVGKDKINDNIILPKIGQITDKVVSFLIGDGVRFDASGDGEQGEIDKRIAALWKANRKQLLMHNIAMSGALAGHIFTRAEPGEKDQPRIVNLNPANCAAFWDVSDVERVLWYRLQFLVGKTGPGKRIDYIHK